MIEFVCYRVPESKLSLAHPGEPCGEDISVSGEDGSHWSDPFVRSQTLLLINKGKDINYSADKCIKDEDMLCSVASFTGVYSLLTHRHHLSFAGVTDTQTSVLTGGAKQTAISVPADAVDEVWVVVHRDEGLTCPHVPDDNQVVTAWSGG